MIIRRFKWQTLTIVPALCAGAWLVLGAGSALGQGSSMGSSSGGGGSSSSGGGSSSSSSSSTSLLGTPGSSSSSQSITSTTTNNLLGSPSSLTSSGLNGTGSLTGGTSSYTPNGRTGPSPSNIVAAYYANPLATGAPNGSTGTTKPFGTPIFVPTNNNLNSANVSSRGANSGSGLGSTGTIAPTTMSVGPRYTSGIGWKPNVATGAGNVRLQTELQNVIANATNLSNPRGIQVAMDGQTVVLRGTAADPHERTLAAAIISMSPGVYGVRNELKVGPATTAGPTTTPAGAVAIPAGSPATTGSPVRQP